MTTVTAAARFSVDGVDLSTLAYVVRAVTGVDEIGPLRGEDAAYSGLPGSQFMGKLRDSRNFALQLTVLATDANGAVTGTSQAQARTNIDALYTILGLGGQRTVSRTLPNGVRTCLAEVTRTTLNPDAAWDTFYSLTAEFRMADPFWYGTALVSGSTPISSNNQTFSITNPGTAPGYRVSFDITGPITGPRVTNTTTGANWEFTGGTVGSGTHLIVDAYAFSATNAGTDVSGLIAHGGAVPFMTVVPGTNSMIVSSTTSGGSIVTTLRPAYW
jgi:hypothetical protein